MNQDGRRMKAVRLVAFGKLLHMQELPLPVVGDRDVLVKVKAAGICHTDAHYRAGITSAIRIPRTLGHEIAGIVEQAGRSVNGVRVGQRVCVHYLATCGDCPYCSSGHDPFCPSGQMIGKDRDGGYAEYVLAPARCAVPLPDDIPFEHGAVLMCSTSTSYHALRKARLNAGETVAVFGAGGLGLSAIQLAQAFGAPEVYAVDINDEKLDRAGRLGAVPIKGAEGDPVAEIRRLTGGKGVDVALEMAGLPLTAKQAIQSVGILGRAVLVGLSASTFDVKPYPDILGREVEIIGSSDHLLSELPPVLDLARRRLIDLSDVITRTVPLDADAINAAMDELERFGGNARTVIVP